MKQILVLAVACLLSVPVLAQSEPTRTIGDEELTELLRVKLRAVRHMALNPRLVRAVRRQNAQALGAETIEQRDRIWQAGKELTAFKRSLQESPAGQFLMRTVNSNDSFNEAFLTDSAGANVAAFPATSDYFQGDEEKWANSFNGGQGKLFIGPLELDDSTGTQAVQVSAPVVDRGRTIGVLVVGVTLDYLDTRSSHR